MKRIRFDSMRTGRVSLTALALVACLMGQPSVKAELVLESSSGSTSYAIFNTTAGTSSGSFSDFSSSYGLLTDPGKNLPALDTVVANSSQMFSTSALSPAFTTSATSTPSNFGSASTQIYTGYSGTEGNSLTQGGVYWSSSTKLADNLGSSTNLASVSYSMATATYLNNGTTSITINPGALLSISGTLGGSTSYIAGGLTTNITIYPGTDSEQTTYASIILAANGAGTSVDSIQGTPGNTSKDYAAVDVNTTTEIVTGSASALLPSISLSPGEEVQVQSYLTLISDPHSRIEITQDIPPGETVLPGFGAIAAAAPAILVPEPSTLVLLSSGLAAVGYWGRTNRKRRSSKS